MNLNVNIYGVNYYKDAVIKLLKYQHEIDIGVKELLNQLKDGKEIKLTNTTLRLENNPDNEYDNYAVKFMYDLPSGESIHLGYLEKFYNKEVFEINNEFQLYAKNLTLTIYNYRDSNKFKINCYIEIPE